MEPVPRRAGQPGIPGVGRGPENTGRDARGCQRMNGWLRDAWMAEDAQMAEDERMVEDAQVAEDERMVEDARMAEGHADG